MLRNKLRPPTQTVSEFPSTRMPVRSLFLQRLVITGAYLYLLWQGRYRTCLVPFLWNQDAGRFLVDPQLYQTSTCSNIYVLLKRLLCFFINCQEKTRGVQNKTGISLGSPLPGSEDGYSLSGAILLQPGVQESGCFSVSRYTFSHLTQRLASRPSELPVSIEHPASMATISQRTEAAACLEHEVRETEDGKLCQGAHHQLIVVLQRK
jgi:hypothetical protein